MSEGFSSPGDAAERLRGAGYIADEPISAAVYLAGALEKPLLLEGPAGVGKTELAKATAAALGTELVRLQCYEGLDEARALYEWKYSKQLLYTQMLREQIGAVVAGATDLSDAVERIASHEDAFFSERFLEPRPLLRAIRAERRVVLLIDEVDRSEEELEAFFLEVLGEFQVTVPEIGTVAAKHPPLVFLTSNDTRELSDALRRRCLHLSLGYPSPEREAEIVRAHVPELAETLADAAARLVGRVRELELKKSPSVSETIDFCRALLLLRAKSLAPELVAQLSSVLLKYQGDQELLRESAAELLASKR